MDDDADYVALCHWARDNTARDAIFIVPPHEQSMRLHGRRAILVNFKGIPQLSAEMPEWRLRLERLLDLDLATLPRRMDHAHAALADRYRRLDPAHQTAIADLYGARYVVREGEITHPRWRTIYTGSTYRIYEVLPKTR
jgi:hypothetical protein